MIEFEFDSTPETDAMLKQLCVKECFVRCKDCKYFCPDEKWDKDSDYCFCRLIGIEMTADDFCSKGERRDEID